jgi:hypothetical protein
MIVNGFRVIWCSWPLDQPLRDSHIWHQTWKTSLKQAVETRLECPSIAVTSGTVMAMAGRHWHLCRFFLSFLSFFVSFFHPFFLCFILPSFLPSFFPTLTLVLSHSCFHSVLLFISWKSSVSVIWHRVHWHKFTDFWSNIFNYREKSVHFHQSPQRHMPQDGNPHPHRTKNFISLIDLFLSSILHSSFLTLFLKFFPYLCSFCLFLLFLHLTIIQDCTELERMWLIWWSDIYVSYYEKLQRSVQLKQTLSSTWHTVYPHDVSAVLSALFFQPYDIWSTKGNKESSKLQN